MSERVQVDIKEGVARLTLNRPDAANAIDVPMADSIMDAAVRVAEDRAVRAVVMTGAGRMFCAGGDIMAFADDLDQAHAVIARITAPLHAGIARLATMDKPLITLVNGPAAGAGLGLALLGDIVVASTASHFTSAYTAIGMSPDAATSWLLPRVAGMRRAQDMVMTNRRVLPDEALACGMVTAVAAPDEVETVVASYLDKLRASSPGALGVSRRLLAEALSSDLSGHLEREAAGIVGRAGSDDGKAAIKGFFERKK